MVSDIIQTIKKDNQMNIIITHSSTLYDSLLVYWTSDFSVYGTRECNYVVDNIVIYFFYVFSHVVNLQPLSFIPLVNMYNDFHSAAILCLIDFSSRDVTERAQGLLLPIASINVSVFGFLFVGVTWKKTHKFTCSRWQASSSWQTPMSQAYSTDTTKRIKDTA